MSENNATYSSIPTLSGDHFNINKLISAINYVTDNVDAIYKSTHTRSEYLFYKLGQKTSSFIGFVKSPQMKAIAIIIFWAFFVTSWIMAAFAINTVSAFVIFGAIIALYTNLTATAVSAIVKNTMINYYSGIFSNV